MKSSDRHKITSTSTRANQNGFGLVEVLILIFVLTFIGGATFFAFSRMNPDKSDSNSPIKTDGMKEYTDRISVFLSGATDKKFDNYYKVGFQLEDLLIGCGVSNNVEVESKEQYEGDKLQIKVTHSVQKDVTDSSDATCLALPQPYTESIDIKKEWIEKGGELSVAVNESQHVLKVDLEKRTLQLDNGSPLPYYPDKIAVLSAYPCSRDASKDLLAFANTSGFTLADQKYPGLDNLYRRPTKELHVVYDKKVEDIKQQYEKKYTDRHGNIISPECTPRVTVPNLHDLNQQLSE